MADDNKDPKGQQGQQEPDEGQAGAQGGQEPNGGANEPQGGQGGTQGSTVNRYKYERDIKAKDDRIKELEDQLAGKQKDGDDLSALRKEFDAYKAEQEAAKTSSTLEKAGCINVKAASALLDDYDGDVAKLKEAVPYLFKSDNANKNTGGNPKGDPQAQGEREKRMRQYLGLE